MSTYDLSDLQSDPAPLIASIKAGESATITCDGAPFAELRPVEDNQPTQPTKKKRRSDGVPPADFVVPDDFNDPLPDDIMRNLG